MPPWRRQHGLVGGGERIVGDEPLDFLLLLLNDKRMVNVSVMKRGDLKADYEDEQELPESEAGGHGVLRD
jgi:hypothetical protein